MIKLYKYLYYRLYTWNKRNWGEKDFPQWNALFGVSFMMFLNLSLIGLLLQFLGVNIFLLNEVPKKEIVIIMLSLFALNYFLFIYNGKYKKIVEELKKENPSKRKTNTILLWVYTVLSFFLYAVGAFLIGILKGLH